MFGFYLLAFKFFHVFYLLIYLFYWGIAALQCLLASAAQ